MSSRIALPAIVMLALSALPSVDLHTQGAYVLYGTAAATTAPPPEMLQIVSAEPLEFWSPMKVVGTLSLCMLVFAFTAIIARRKRAGLAEGS